VELRKERDVMEMAKIKRMRMKKRKNEQNPYL
jgi:hypothetical protein